MTFKTLLLAGVMLFSVLAQVSAGELPHLTARNGRQALIVDGAPFTVLAVQPHNSSAWPARMGKVWHAVDSMHGNTIEAPVYWEQFEPVQGRFDYSSVDMLVKQARLHKVRLILLWFGTWKNGQMHYIPEWMKRDRIRYPRVLDIQGEAVDVLSPTSDHNLDADKTAFVSLMRHLKSLDDAAHTVVMVQVENEPGLIGSPRDYGAAAQKLFEGPVPAAALPPGKAPGQSWQSLFGADANETFTAYYVARYIEAIAAAGKEAYPLPFYVNVWMRYKGFVLPGKDYPSGGAVWTALDMWKRTAPHIDLIGTDVYTQDFAEYRRAVMPYDRVDNSPWISECEFGASTSRYLFDILAHGGIGGSVFGVDEDAAARDDDSEAAVTRATEAHTNNFRLLAPMQRFLAEAAWDRRVFAAVEQPGKLLTSLPLPDGWRAKISFGTFRPEGGLTRLVPGRSGDGRVLIIRQDPSHLIVIGFGARVQLVHDSSTSPAEEILRVEEGTIQGSSWNPDRILNGDETDFGLDFGLEGNVVRMTIH